MDFNLLKEMRDFLQWRSSEAILLAEANVPPDESLEYFGAEGDRLQMMLNFPVNQRLFTASHGSPRARRPVRAAGPVGEARRDQRRAVRDRGTADTRPASRMSS